MCFHEGKPNEQYWTWSKTSPIATQIIMKLIYDYEGITPDQVYECIQFDHRKIWEKIETPIIEHVDFIENEGAQVIYHALKKPPIPMIDIRDMIYKSYSRKNYLLSTTGGSSIHILARESIEHPNYPPG